MKKMKMSLAKPKKDTSLQSYLKVALEAAELGGAFLKKKYGKFKELSEKPHAGLVTEADVGAERIIIRKIKSTFPTHNFLAEESGAIKHDSSSPRWIIDPLDGTTNFVHGFPFFCVSIGLEINGKLMVGVVHNPISGQTYYGVKNGGSYLNGKRLRVSTLTKLSDALLTTGFSYKKLSHLKEELKTFERIIKKARAMRRTGSAALDLCHVAAGQFDGFFEKGLSPWDVAAGLLILEEAGGKYTTFSGKSYRLGDEDVLVSNGKIHRVLLKAIS